MAAVYSGVSTVGDVVAIPQLILDIYSSDILYTAMGIMRFEEFAVQKEDLMVSPGQTITMNRFNNITRGSTLTEGTALEEKAMSMSQRAVTVTEWGNAIGVTEKQLAMSYEDTLKNAAILLGRDYAVVNDLMLRDALTGGTNVYYAGNQASGAALVPGTDYFDIESIRKGVEILQNSNAPKFGGKFYVCFAHPHQIAYLKRDPDWIAANNYANTRNLFTGEVGMWEDTVFISTTHCRNGAAGTLDPGYEATFATLAGGTDPVYEAYLFADSALGKATALPVEMRQKEREDYGRKHGLAWYSIMGAAILEDDFLVRMQSV